MRYIIFIFIAIYLSMFSGCEKAKTSSYGIDAVFACTNNTDYCYRTLPDCRQLQ